MITRDAIGGENARELMDSLSLIFDEVRLIFPGNHYLFSIADFQKSPSSPEEMDEAQSDRTEKDVYKLQMPVLISNGPVYPCSLELVSFVCESDRQNPNLLSAIVNRRSRPIPETPEMAAGRLLSDALRGSSVAIIITKPDQSVIFANAEAWRLFCSENDIQLQEELGKVMHQLDHGDSNPSVPSRFRGLSPMRFTFFDQKGGHAGYCFAFLPRGSEPKARSIDLFFSRYDLLTSLYTKEAFYKEVRKELNANYQRSYLCVLMNIRDFKLVNSFYGIRTGNRVLSEVGSILMSRTKPGHIYGRLRDDIFALLIPDSSFREDSLVQFSAEIRRRAAAQSLPSDLRLQFGIYRIAYPDLNISIMCDRASMALRSIHDDLPCSIAWYSDDLLAALLNEKRVISAFDKALSLGNIRMYLQPQTREDGTVVGAEALSRWIDYQGNVVMPDKFIQILEKAGLVYQLDRYIWEQAAKALSSWQKDPDNKLYISVNVSVRDIYYLDIETVFTQLVRKYGIDSSRLKIEFTETAIMSDIAKYQDLVSRLHSHGFEVEIDDFGAGYSSLNTLKNINADILKIDMGFLQNAEKPERCRVILHAIVSMANELNIPVVTEGVTSQEQVESLSSIGCHYFQGFYFSEAIPEEQFAAHYLKRA